MGETVRFADNTGLPAQGLQYREVTQHGSIGEFIGSSLEGVDSGFIRCVYNAKNQSGSSVSKAPFCSKKRTQFLVTLLCEKMEGCCVNGCCPKDQFWMTGLIILLIFVLVVFCCGTVAIIVCYQRTKSRQRRAEKEIYQSRMGSEAGLGMYTRPTYQQYGTGGYPRGPVSHYDQQHQQNVASQQSRRF